MTMRTLRLGMAALISLAGLSAVRGLPLKDDKPVANTTKPGAYTFTPEQLTTIRASLAESTKHDSYGLSPIGRVVVKDSPHRAADPAIANMTKVDMSVIESVAQAIQQDYPGIMVLDPPYNKTLEGRNGHRGPEDDHNTFISIINATPYRWRKIYSSQFQVMSWKSRWPEFVNPGQAVTVLVENYGGFIRGDSAAEVSYRLEDTQKPMAFQVQYRNGNNNENKHNVYVQFLENLTTLDNEINSEHFLGFQRRPGGVGFLLAGTEGDFISNDAPARWMQKQLHEIGHLPLREISLPRSHHSGQWKNSETLGLGSPRNTQTQTLPLNEQLIDAGVRVLDVRPVMRHNRFYEAHGSFVGSLFHGMTGAPLNKMVELANEFTRLYPGELIIWDIHEGDARNGDKHFELIDDDARLKLYQELLRLKHRIVLPDDEDITKWPLERFISDLRTAVLIRVSSTWAGKKHFPGGREGFVSGLNFPLKTRWSNTNDARELSRDQIEGLREARPSRDAQVYNMDWLLTQKGVEVAFPNDSILEMSRGAWQTYYQDFWEALTDQSYPNMVTLDNIHGNQQKTMSMVINKCFAARKCGELGGKVVGVLDEPTHVGNHTNLGSM